MNAPKGIRARHDHTSAEELAVLEPFNPHALKGGDRVLVRTMSYGTYRELWRESHIASKTPRFVKTSPFASEALLESRPGVLPVGQPGFGVDFTIPKTGMHVYLRTRAAMHGEDALLIPYSERVLEVQRAWVNRYEARIRFDAALDAYRELAGDRSAPELNMLCQRLEALTRGVRPYLDGGET